MTAGGAAGWPNRLASLAAFFSGAAAASSGELPSPASQASVGSPLWLTAGKI